MVPGSSANGNNQIDIHQNLHPFNHNVIAQEKNKLTKSNYVSSDQYKPFEGLPNTVDKIQYPQTEERAKITYCTFNQDFTCIAIGTEKHGFSIYQANPLAKMY